MRIMQKEYITRSLIYYEILHNRTAIIHVLMHHYRMFDTYFSLFYFFFKYKFSNDDINS